MLSVIPGLERWETGGTSPRAGLKEHSFRVFIKTYSFQTLPFFLSLRLFRFWPRLQAFLVAAQLPSFGGYSYVT